LTLVEPPLPCGGSSSDVRANGAPADGLQRRERECRWNGDSCSKPSGQFRMIIGSCDRAKLAVTVERELAPPRRNSS
jgi:hypothetical protein